VAYFWGSGDCSGTLVAEWYGSGGELCQQVATANSAEITIDQGNLVFIVYADAGCTQEGGSGVCSNNQVINSFRIIEVDT
jgi:hypothetical protein